MSLLGSFGKALVGGVTGFATGGFAGAAVGLASSFQGGGSKPGTAMVPYTGGGSPAGVPDWLNIGPKITMPFGLGLPGFGPAAATSCPKGYHLNKHPLAASKRHGAVAAHSMCVRNRHLNPLNPKAVTRSLRRLKRARKLVTKLHAFGTSRSVARVGGRGHRPGCGCVVCRRR